ncbi:MAG: hypothetical protein IIV05_03840 [Ruminococcus sp.]|nr:hypothetical protein [Ruminococcus sp.]
MNDNDATSRRGALSMVLFYAASAFLILFAFIIGYSPKTNQAALQLGGVCFFLYAIIYLLRMSARLGDWITGEVHDENAERLIIYSLIGFGVAVVFYLVGLLIPYRRRKRAWEDAL